MPRAHLGNCQFPGCQSKALYTRYEFVVNPNGDFLKYWRHFCDMHEKMVAKEMIALKKSYPDAVWREPKK